MSNASLFASVAREYADFRPGYPPELFAWLARVSPARRAVWDVGCGSGQASIALAEHFDEVLATDVSPEQITAAKLHPRVSYRVAPAERSGLADSSVDLVTVAQALHWFEVEAFYAEARRVARRGAVLAVWNYPRPRFEDPALERAFLAFYTEVVGPYWPAERRHIEANYETLPFPFEPLEAPPFALRLEWTLAQVLGYVSSWSATARYRAARDQDPVALLADVLGALWPATHTAMTLRMPLGLRAGRLAPGPGAG
jgi:SAM-dependent methyltransferase